MPESGRQRIETIPRDHLDRERIRTDLETTFLVEAGAGSGKTRSLVERMIALLAAGRCTIDSLTAVTFTRKATAEMRERFQIGLERAVHGESDPAAQSRLKAALDHFERCRIGTIHSFCAGLLRERPVENGLDPGFREMDEIEDAVFRRQSWRNILERSREESRDSTDRLARVGLVPDELEGAFNEISKYPDVALAPGRPDPPDTDFFRSLLEDFLAAAQKELPRARPERGWDKLQETLNRCLAISRNVGLDSPPVLMSAFELMDRDVGITQNRWPNRQAALAMKSRFDRFRTDVVDPALKHWREHRHSLILEWLEPVREQTRQRRRDAGLMNYEDLLMRSAELLRDHPEVRDSFRERITHILVDEFQDTDPVQAEVLFLLTGTDSRERDWRRLRPRPGSLFLVGDPKQSIYRFRRADIDTYNLVKKMILGAGGEVLELTTNFRSLDRLGDWSNPVFRSLFPSPETRYQAAFAELDTVRKSGPPSSDSLPAGVFRLTVPKIKWSRLKDIAEADAQAIADWIASACSGSGRLQRAPEDEERLKAAFGAAADPGRVRPGDVLILFRFRKNMPIYARALEERGLPFEIAGSDAFSESEEIRHLLNLARALNEPGNPIFTIAALRGLFFGISDVELYEFTRGGGTFQFLTGVRRVDSPGEKRVSAALDRLREWWAWTRKDPPSAVLDRILESSGIVAYLAGGEMGSSRAGNFFKLLEKLRERESEEGLSFAGAGVFLEDLAARPNVDEMSLFPGRSDAVRLMNLHKAKGLEAPIVFLANPAGARPHEPERHVRRIVRDEKSGGEEYGAAEGAFAFHISERYQRRLISQPVGWKERAVEEKRYLQAEEIRLMYVAATRARNLLVISRYPPMDGARLAWAELDAPSKTRPELPLLPVVDRPHRRILEYDSAALTEVRRKLADCLYEAAAPRVLRETVTSLAKAEGERPFRDSAGSGMAWGRMVHGILEGLARNPRSDPKRLVLNALTAEAWDPDQAGRLLELIDRIRGSRLWDRAMNSTRRFVETPFCLLSDEKELGRMGEMEGRRPARPVYLHGVIDLVFRETGGWVIVDYKTDAVIDRLERYVEYYTPQVVLYRRFWEKLTGGTVKESGLFFTDFEKPRWIKIS